MAGLLQHFLISLRMNFRNPQALIMGYLVPLFFLIAFRALYATMPPLQKEFAMAVTISILGGACFGLPVALVSERDRGVWRRYRLVPAPTWAFVVSVMAVRYLLIISSTLLLLAVAMGVFKMPLPARPLELFAACSVSVVSFLGLGLVIAMLANSALAVQYMGQCIFLPMLILGGVAVKIELLPVWAREIALFLPGFYAVRVMNECILPKGLGLSGKHALFDLAALTLIGLACCFIAVKLFRWETEQKRSVGAKAWALLALLMWLGVGVVVQYLKLA